MVRELDPKTVTVEELADVSRRLRRAKTAGLVVGALVALAIILFVLPRSPILSEYGFIVIVLAFAGAYRLTFEVLQPR